MRLTSTLTLSSLAAFLLAGSAWGMQPQAATGPIGDGLQFSADSESAWSPWQARLNYTSPVLPLWGPASGGWLLAGDRYFAWGRLGDAGGLRATGGVMLGAAAAGRSAADNFWRPPVSPADSEAVPYLGLGYSAWWARTGVGVSADVGVAAQRPDEAVRFGRVVSGGDSLDGMVRAMQVAPMLQLNLSYSF